MGGFGSQRQALTFLQKYNIIKKKGGAMVKKQLITKDDIRRDLLAKINKSKKLSIILTMITAAAIPAYIAFIINYDAIMTEYTSGHLAGRAFHPVLGIFVSPLVILFFVIFLLDFYYIDLVKASRGKFLIFKERVCQQKK
jgi:hypothetical protein